ncbi:MAG: ureidoglycolate lyase [Dehalococcoidia bacterium]
MQTATQVREIPVEWATPENVAPFGEILGAGPAGQGRASAFYEGAVRTFSPVNFISDEDTELVVSAVDRRQLSVRFLERHYKHTQTFIPLDGKPVLVVVAPPNDGDEPDLDQVRALLFDGSVGFVMKLGTWHEFPFALVDRTNVVVILRHETTRSLLPDQKIAGEAHGPDIDKLDIVERTGVTIVPKLAAADRARVFTPRR